MSANWKKEFAPRPSVEEVFARALLVSMERLFAEPEWQAKTADEVAEACADEAAAVAVQYESFCKIEDEIDAE